MIHNLFPTPVAIYKLERDLTAKELSFNTFPIGLVGDEMNLTGLQLESVKG